MDRPTYKGGRKREGREGKQGEGVFPGRYGSPGSRGARIVTVSGLAAGLRLTVAYDCVSL